MYDNNELFFNLYLLCSVTLTVHVVLLAGAGNDLVARQLRRVMVFQPKMFNGLSLVLIDLLFDSITC